MTKCLTPEGQALLDDFKDNYNNCSCHSHPPCSSCTHEGHPISLVETEDVWQYSEDSDTATYDEVESMT
jgi:hypothetical protein